MKNYIALDGSAIHEKSGGIRIYFENLLHELKQNELSDRIIPFCSEKVDIFPDCEKIPLDPFNPVQRNLRARLVWPRLIEKYNIGLYHSPISYLAAKTNIPSIVTIHDLRYFHYPHSYPRLRGWFLKAKIPASIRRARAIIAISEFTRNDIMRLFSIPREKIHMIYQGIDADRFSQSQLSDDWISIQRRYRLPDEYMLAVGHLEPRKNYEGLLKALAFIRDHFHLHYHLVICGQENWYFKSIYDLAKSLDLLSLVHFSGFVSDQHIVSLYQNASLFIAPSLFEGFGFTPLEACAAGVPVLASNATTHPETLKDAALYFDPLEYKDLAEKIVRLEQNERKKAELVEKGQKRVKEFSWSVCAEQTATLYRHMLNL